MWFNMEMPFIVIAIRKLYMTVRRLYMVIRRLYMAVRRLYMAVMKLYVVDFGRRGEGLRCRLF